MFCLFSYYLKNASLLLSTTVIQIGGWVIFFDIRVSDMSLCFCVGMFFYKISQAIPGHSRRYFLRCRENLFLSCIVLSLFGCILQSLIPLHVGVLAVFYSLCRGRFILSFLQVLLSLVLFLFGGSKARKYQKLM